MIDTPDKDPVRFLEKQIKKYDIINNLETMAIQTPNICKWTCNENIDKELSNEFWNNPTIMDKQKSSLIKFRTGTYMGQARKQTFFDRQKFPTITYPICNSYEPNTWLHVDNTFEYEGGLRRVTEDAFLCNFERAAENQAVSTEEGIANRQGKAETYSAETLGNLCRLISEDHKMKEAKRLNNNRAQVKRPSLVGRIEGDLTTNLVTYKL